MRIALFAVLMACGGSSESPAAESSSTGSSPAGSSSEETGPTAFVGSASSGSGSGSVASISGSAAPRSDEQATKDRFEEILRDGPTDDAVTMTRLRAIQQAHEAGVLAPTPNGGNGHALTREEINGVMTRAAATFKVCFVAHLDSHPGAHGKVATSFTIGAAGTVSAVTARGLDNKMETCIKTAIEKLIFPASGSASKVTFPLVFSGQ